MTDLKEQFGGKVKSTPLKEALKPKSVVEYTPDQVKLSELGIPIESAKTLALIWKKQHKKEKIFSPNNKSLNNITDEFWDFVMDAIHPVDLLKINTSLLPEELADMTLKQIENKGGSDDSQKRIKELLDLVEMLQEDGANVLKLLELLNEFMNTKMIFKTKMIQCKICGDVFDFAESKKDIVNDEDIVRLKEIEEVLEK